MALKHAILVSLAEKTASGYDLARRFDRSLGFFWQASHQQIYRVLADLEASGDIQASSAAGAGRRERRTYRLTESGRAALHQWSTEPTPLEQSRSEFAVKVRGMQHGSPEAVLTDIRRQLAAHQERLSYFEAEAARNYPEPAALTPDQLPLYLVLRGGIRSEESYIGWCQEMLQLLEERS
ncbi:PadR family transcriptional regulator [Acaricomes phytoseiuli]|uniref:PadR family transcriptional regulator n=1 Tax=Acaricomes phytoseiuli TaxID=291968 RepID=UPI000380E97A|nr:PadR family transcriptional regulator [Acaricomes phytoseiuli]